MSGPDFFDDGLLEQVIAIADGLILEAIGSLDDQCKALMVGNWHIGRDNLLLGFNIKLAHWDCLPWKVAGIGNGQDVALARQCGHESVRLYQTRGTQMRLARRLLGPSFHEDGETSLRGDLDAFRYGGDLQGELADLVWDSKTSVERIRGRLNIYGMAM